MSNFFNSHEIDEIASAVRRNAPELVIYANALTQWRDIVDSHSDGWHVWPGGRKAAAQLSGLLAGARYPYAWQRPTMAECRKAMGSIKRTATRQNLPAPVVVEPVAPKISAQPRPIK